MTEKRMNAIRWNVGLVVLLVTVSFAISIFSGCTDSPEKLFQKADVMYLDIKTIVTDPAVAVFIPEPTMQRLAIAEQVYLRASALKEQDNENALRLLANVADEVINLVEDLQVAEKYQPQIDAIRVVLKILRNHIQAV